MSLLKDSIETKRRVALLSHCLANQNAKVDEYALCPGIVTPVTAVLKECGYAIQQMPCPELTFLGVDRWWQVREQYDKPSYRRHCQTLAHAVADLVEQWVSRGYEEVVLIGVDGSPSSGVRWTDHGVNWGGRPEIPPEEYQTVPGKGIWIEELEQVFVQRGLPIPRAIGVAMESPDFDWDEAIAELRLFLTLS